MAVLFYRKFRYDSRGPGQVVWTRETDKYEVRTNVSQQSDRVGSQPGSTTASEPAGFNSVARDPCFDSHLTLILPPRGY